MIHYTRLIVSPTFAIRTIAPGQEMGGNRRLENPRRTKMGTPHHCPLRNSVDHLKMDWVA